MGDTEVQYSEVCSGEVLVVRAVYLSITTRCDVGRNVRNNDVLAEVEKNLETCPCCKPYQVISSNIW